MYSLAGRLMTTSGSPLPIMDSHRHAGTYGFVCLKQLALDVTVERSVKPGVSQFVLVMLVFGRDLFQTVYGLVVVVRCGSLILVQGNDTFGFGLDLAVLGFRAVKLHLVVG